jgi:integrase
VSKINVQAAGNGSDRRINFTQRAIAAIVAPEKKRATYHDTQVPELGLLAQPSGHKSFFWFRKVRGVPTWKTLGTIDDISLEQARDKARDLSGSLGTWKLNDFKGDSPFETARGEPTFGELVDAYCERHVLPHANRPERAEKGVRWSVNFYLASWKGRRLDVIRRKDVLKLHADLGEERGQYTANRVVQLVRALFNFATAAELWRGENPAIKIKLFHEAKRTRFLQPDEVPRLFKALKNEPNPDVVDFVNLSLWTGARKSDVLAMRWQDISLADNRWTVPDPKNRTPYQIALTPEAITILKKRQKGSPWVFPSFGKTGHVVDLKKRWQELLKRAKITNLRQHDLRRTLGSWQAAQGASLQIIGKSLGHTSVQATQIYSQLDLDPVRDSVSAATQAIIAASKKKPKLLAGNHD